jgi:hypothetical protein
MKAVYQMAGFLKEYFPINFARIILISQIVLALIKVKTVSLNEIAAGFAGKTKTDSNERRMRRFFKDFSLDPDFIALFVASKLPGGKWLLTVDRTEWEFGKIKINILMLAVVYKGVAVPLLWKFLTKKDDPDIGKKGNSNTEERKELTEQFIRLFGKERIEAIAADREFIGNQWFLWLKTNHINIVIRIRENQQVTDSRGIYTRVSSLFRDLKIGESRILKGLRKIGDARVFVCGMRLPTGKLLIVVTFDAPEKALEIYAKRWQIETMFACLKTRGFRFESTHLGDFDRISRLLGIVVIAFVWVYLIGDSLNEIKPITVKKHGYRAESIFKKGFDHLRRILLNMSEYIDEFAEAIRVFSVSSKYFFKSHKLCDLK